jgi:hypothetical protein
LPDKFLPVPGEPTKARHGIGAHFFKTFSDLEENPRSPQAFLFPRPRRQPFKGYLGHIADLRAGLALANLLTLLLRPVGAHKENPEAASSTSVMGKQQSPPRAWWQGRVWTDKM